MQHWYGMLTLHLLLLIMCCAAPAKSAQGGKGAAAPESTFLLHPSSMDLAMDETLDLSVFAFPTAEGLEEDVIMCR
jgi:hypothetical protein